MTVATAHQGTLGGILSVPWHSSGAVNIDGLLVNNALLTHIPRCTWKRCHALFLQAFNEMVAHTILVVLVLMWILAITEYHSKSKGKQTTVTCPILSLHIHMLDNKRFLHCVQNQRHLLL